MDSAGEGDVARPPGECFQFVLFYRLAWQAEAKDGSLPGRRLHFCPSVVGFGNRLHEAEAKPHAGSGPAAIGAEQPVPDPGQIFGRDTEAIIFDPQKNFPFIRIG